MKMSLTNLVGAKPRYINPLEETYLENECEALQEQCQDFQEELKSWGKCSSERLKEPMSALSPLEHLVRCLISSMLDGDRTLGKKIRTHPSTIPD